MIFLYTYYIIGMNLNLKKTGGRSRMRACEYNYLNVSVQQDKCVTVGNIFSTLCVSDH